MAQDNESKMARTLDTIAKLLAKAEASTFPAEAEAFTEHAERLMIRYGIEQAQVDAERGRLGQTQEPIVEERKVLTGTYKGAQLDGLCWVMNSYRLVTTLSSNGYNSKTLFVIGAESDVAQMLQLADSMVIQQDAALKAWWAAARKDRSWMTEREKYLERREFVSGFFRGAARKMADIMGEEAVGGKELVLVGRKARADDWVGEQYPDIKQARDRKLSRGTAEASRDGVSAGLKSDVNSRKLDKAAAFGVLA